MKAKHFLVAAALACNAAYGFTVDTDVYFAIAKMDQGRFTFMLSKQACQYANTDKSKWKKAAIHVQYDTGGAELREGCWMKDKQPDDAYGHPIDLKVCMVVDGVIRTPCRKTEFRAFTKTSDLPKAPSEADF